MAEEVVLAGGSLAPSASPPSRGHRRTRSGELPAVPILVAARVRPDVRAVGRFRTEEGFPYADTRTIEALRLEEAARASIKCHVDPLDPVRKCNMPLPLASRVACLMCRHPRLGTGCADGMARVPEELWLRIFGAAPTPTAFANLVELGPPPGSNATVGVINAPTPPAEPTTAVDEDEGRRYACGLAFGPEASQEEIYESNGAELLEGALEGYNATILACTRAHRLTCRSVHASIRARG
jgi:hypothetical protein